MHWTPIVQRLFQSIEDEARMGGAADPPANDASGEGIDNKCYIDKTLPRRHVGVSRPEEFHLQPLAEPDVNLSAHPAPIIRPRPQTPSTSV